ncbi:MAG TPA: nuclear transport factor 2 family protein [Pyrinomonadaceae bacterium]|jgi:hypothetical protein
MKRMILLASLLLAASGCATETQAPNNTPAPSSNVNAAATPQTAATISEADIIAREKQIWDALKNKDYDGFAAMLADDQLEVFGSGVNDKATSVNGVKSLVLTDAALSDWKVVVIDKDAAVVTYTASLKGTQNGKPLPTNTERASTAWVNRGGKWLAVYHQGTEATQSKENAPATTSGSPSTSKTTTTTTKTEASPSASGSPASTSSSSGDAIDREKQVWEMLKRKDYDGFASMLADDQIEVEPDGVYDKAGTIKGVRQVDFTSASLSDFKMLKLDDDAALVIYLVKMPAQGSEPADERHSTIWANRGGKWLAVFHQGTPVKSAQPK